MLSFFLNPWMLIGLAGIALPIIAHLLVRRRYDVVDWGAMQFLQPGRRTRRRLQLQDLLLLLTRILLTALIAIALARPWIRSGMFSGYQSAGSRDVVLIIDSSNSMSRPDGISTLQQTALRRATEFLGTLSSNDTAMLIDARDAPIPIIDVPLSRPRVVAEALREIGPPAGYGDLLLACERAISLLAQASHPQREIIVFTDRQQSGWRSDQLQQWKQLDRLKNLGSVVPRLWVVDCGAHLAAPENRISINSLTVSADEAVPGTPVNLQATLTNHSDQSLTIPVSLQAHGQQLAQHNSSVTIAAASQTSIGFTHQFQDEQLWHLTVQADDAEDELQIDNVARATLLTRPAINVLLVESSTDLKRARNKTFFIQAALSPRDQTAAWVQATVVQAADLTRNQIAAADVVVIPNCDALPVNASMWIEQAVRGGTGLFIATGGQVTAESFDTLFVESGLLPNAALTEHRSADPDAGVPLRVLPSSLQDDWLRRFQDRPDSSFLQAVFERWSAFRFSDIPDSSTVHAAMSLTNNAPILFERQHHDGRILLLATSLDTEWNNLPGRPDFVTFLYEAVFHLAPQQTNRNLQPAEAFTAIVQDPSTETLRVTGPGGLSDTARLRVLRRPSASVMKGDNSLESAPLVVRYDRTVVPGHYSIEDPATNERLDGFSVDYNHAEDSNQQLTDADRAVLSSGNRLTFASSLSNLQVKMYADETNAELWTVLLIVFVLLLLLESWMTRRLVLQRHGDGQDAVDGAPVRGESAGAEN